MKVVDRIRNILYEPGVLALDVDEVDLIAAHKGILENKPLLRSAFETFYSDMIESCERFLPVSGLEIELGSGVGFFKRFRPQAILRAGKGNGRAGEPRRFHRPLERIWQITHEL